MNLKRTQIFGIAAVATLTVGLFVGISAATTSTPSTFYGCMSKSMHIHSIQGDVAPTCDDGQTLVSWSQQGPPGTPGAPGAPGAPGTPGAPGAPGAPGPGAQFFTSTDVYTVPQGVSHLEITAVGGGGGGGGYSSTWSGGGGGQGATQTVLANVNPGDQLLVHVGQPGLRGISTSTFCTSAGSGSDGGPTSVSQFASTYVNAFGGSGGHGGNNCLGGIGGAGGSGGIPAQNVAGLAISAAVGTGGLSGGGNCANGGGVAATAGSGQDGDNSIIPCAASSPEGGYVEILAY
jgi:hypothetical protein